MTDFRKHKKKNASNKMQLKLWNSFPQDAGDVKSLCEFKK